jgi:hypothetical protein
MGIFDPFIPKAWPITFEGRIRVVNEIHGGIPSNIVTIENWLKTRVDKGNTQLYTEEMAKAVHQVWEERGKQGIVPTDEVAQEVTDEAIKRVAKNVGASGFKRGLPVDGEHNGQLFYEGRCLKACFKEGASVAYAAGKLLALEKGKKLSDKGKNSYGLTSKGIQSFTAEHVQILEDKLWLERRGEDDEIIPVMEPTDINVHPVHLWNGNALSQEEYVTGAEFNFTVMTDWEFPEEFWAMVWLTAQLQGIGSSRSMGYGRFEVIEWDRVETTTSHKARA